MKKSIIYGISLLGVLVLTSCNLKTKFNKMFTDYENSDVTFQTLEYEEEISECERINLISKFYEKMNTVKSYQLENYDYELNGNYENYSYDRSNVTFYDDYFLKCDLEIYNKETDDNLIISDTDTANIYEFIVDDSRFYICDYKKYSDDDHFSFYNYEKNDSFYTDCFLNSKAFGFENADLFRKGKYYYMAYSNIDEEVNEITVGSELKYEKNITRIQSVVKLNEDGEALTATYYKDEMSNRDKNTNEFLDDIVTFKREVSKASYKYGSRKARPNIEKTLEFTTILDNSFNVSLKVSDDKSEFVDYQPVIHKGKTKNFNEGECTFVIPFSEENKYNSLMTEMELSYDYLVLANDEYVTDSKIITISLDDSFDNDNIGETADNKKYYYNETRGEILVNFSYKFDNSTKELKITNVNARFIKL